MHKHFSFYREQTTTHNDIDMTKEERAAQLVVDQSIFSFHKARLMKEIDNALTEGNKPIFLELSKQYNELTEKYAHL
ncbi:MULTISPECIES: IDEAL domain-containing protein [Bacillus]|uniref:IDEAL domain-containing protein n=1 Tax=Bacillus TaxID=1386 RepID=UPI000BB95827|nr:MULTISPECIES: IDEAL domain-containing protein [Bacillus]